MAGSLNLWERETSTVHCGMLSNRSSDGPILTSGSAVPFVFYNGEKNCAAHRTLAST